jgi:tetratricopeptide (TPR) repeat protein
LLRRTRQQHHQRIAQVLEAQFPETVAIQPELLAHHYTEAGLSSQAIVYWYKAGQRAIQLSSHVEAAGHLTKGLAVLLTLPDTLERMQHELRLQLALGAALIAIKGYAASEVENVYIRAQTLCQALGEMPRLLQVLLGLESSYMVQAQLRRAHELAEQCLALAQRLRHPVRLLQSHYTLGGILFHLGEAVAALHHFERGITLYDAQLRQGLTAWRATGAALLLPMFLATLAEVSGKTGQWEDAQDLLREALALVEDTGERFWEAELYRLQGIVLLQQASPDTSRAAACFQQALNVAGHQHAKSLELRAAVSLSRLWQQEGKRAEAYALLAPVYGWFTEGFDTADLQEAKALLEELER